MNRNRLIVALAVAVIVGLFVSSYVYRQLQKQAAVPPPAAMQKVVVAAQRIPLATRLSPEMVHVISWPADQPMTGMFGSIAEVQGRTLVTSVTENEPILEAKLAPTGAGAGLPATIPDGMRALTVAVNDVIGVAGFVVPGTMVDVVVTGTGPGQNGSVTKTVLENVRVLAAGQKIEQDKDGKPQNVPVITLLVTPEDANKLAMASTQGRIQLALRNTIDTQKVNPPAVMQATLFSGGELPAAAPKKTIYKRTVPAAPAPFVVEVLVGNKRENKTFPNQ